MTGIARVGDIGIGTCPCHITPVVYTTTFVSGAASVNSNSVPSCNLTTIGVSSCGHVTTVISVSATVLAEGSGVHRIGDSGMNCGMYSVVSGSGNVIAG